MILHIEILRYPQKILELKNKFIKVEIHKINTYILILYTYTFSE